jgi:hypothetical protein
MTRIVKKRNACRIVGGIHKGKKPLRRSRLRWEF